MEDILYVIRFIFKALQSDLEMLPKEGVAFVKAANKVDAKHRLFSEFKFGTCVDVKEVDTVDKVIVLGSTKECYKTHHKNAGSILVFCDDFHTVSNYMDNHYSEVGFGTSYEYLDHVFYIG